MALSQLTVVMLRDLLVVYCMKVKPEVSVTMANEACVLRILSFIVVTLYAVACILLLQSSSTRCQMKKETIDLRERVNQLNYAVSLLKAELDGPSGCVAQVRGVVLVVKVIATARGVPRADCGRGYPRTRIRRFSCGRGRSAPPNKHICGHGSRTIRGSKATSIVCTGKIAHLLIQVLFR